MLAERLETNLFKSKHSKGRTRRKLVYLGAAVLLLFQVLLDVEATDGTLCVAAEPRLQALVVKIVAAREKVGDVAVLKSL